MICSVWTLLKVFHSGDMALYLPATKKNTPVVLDTITNDLHSLPQMFEHKFRTNENHVHKEKFIGGGLRLV